MPLDFHIQEEPTKLSLDHVGLEYPDWEKLLALANANQLTVLSSLKEFYGADAKVHFSGPELLQLNKEVQQLLTNSELGEELIVKLAKLIELSDSAYKNHKILLTNPD